MKQNRISTFTLKLTIQQENSKLSNLLRVETVAVIFEGEYNTMVAFVKFTILSRSDEMKSIFNEFIIVVGQFEIDFRDTYDEFPL